jgi:glycosyltransferase involved in cell wall biosynthesis
MDASFVIPSFKSRKTIGGTLSSIFSQKSKAAFEVIVVDSSQDSTSTWIRKRFPRVKVISSNLRLSPGAARNLGVTHAKGRYLAFLDADTSAASDWLQKLLHRIQNNPRIRVISGAVEIGNPESTWARVLHWIEFSEFIPGTASGSSTHLSSSNLLVAREDFLDAGGFDESFVMAEDLLLSRAFQGALFFDSTTHVSHYYRTSRKEVLSHLRKLGYWSGQLRSMFETKGSWLKGIPLASFALPPVRTILIIWRIWRKNRLAGLQALGHAPLILAALLFWAIGFYRGLRDRPVQTASN